MKNTKRLVTLSLILVLITTSIVFGAARKEITAICTDIKIMINGHDFIPRNVNGDAVMPISYEGTTYLPVRAIANALDMEVSWDQETRTVILNDKVAEDGFYLTELMQPYESYGFEIPANSVEIGGKEYKNSFSTSSDARFELASHYNTFTGTIYVPKKGNFDEAVNIKIKDISTINDKLLYTRTLEPGVFINFEINVKDIDKIKIGVDGDYRGRLVIFGSPKLK